MFENTEKESAFDIDTFTFISTPALVVLYSAGRLAKFIPHKTASLRRFKWMTVYPLTSCPNHRRSECCLCGKLESIGFESSVHRGSKPSAPSSRIPIFQTKDTAAFACGILLLSRRHRENKRTARALNSLDEQGGHEQ